MVTIEQRWYRKSYCVSTKIRKDTYSASNRPPDDTQCRAIVTSSFLQAVLKGFLAAQELSKGSLQLIKEQQRKCAIVGSPNIEGEDEGYNQH
jgi:hypothetical protein